MKNYNMYMLNNEQFNTKIEETINNNVVLFDGCFWFQINNTLFQLFSNNDVVAYSDKLMEIQENEVGELLSTYYGVPCAFELDIDDQYAKNTIQCGFVKYALDMELRVRIIIAKEKKYIKLNNNKQVTLSKKVEIIKSTDSKQCEFKIENKTIATFVLVNTDDMVIDQYDFKKLSKIIIECEYNTKDFKIKKSTSGKRIKFDLIAE